MVLRKFSVKAVSFSEYLLNWLIYALTLSIRLFITFRTLLIKFAPTLVNLDRVLTGLRKIKNGIYRKCNLSSPLLLKIDIDGD